eukprot:94778_1
MEQASSNIEIVLRHPTQLDNHNTLECNHCHYVNNIQTTATVKCSNCHQFVNYFNTNIDIIEEEEKYATLEYQHSSSFDKTIIDMKEENITGNDYKSENIIDILTTEIPKKINAKRFSIDFIKKQANKRNFTYRSNARPLKSYQSMDDIYQQKQEKKRTSIIQLFSIRKENKTEPKKNENVSLYEQVKDIKKNLTSNFIELKDDDFVCEGDIRQCNVIKRIIHIMEFYVAFKKIMSENATLVIPLYEFIETLKHYHITQFMEDWYQCKQNHFKTNDDIEYFRSKTQTNCARDIKETETNDDIEYFTSKTCFFVNRYQRDRNKDFVDINHETDVKNIMLMDKLNAIHVYIFHFVSTRSPRRLPRIVKTVLPEIIDNHNDENKDNSTTTNTLTKDLTTTDRFTTQVDVVNDDKCYSYGQQYQYTKNFQEHPMYVTPKYRHLKDEVHWYFVRTLRDSQENSINDLAKGKRDLRSLLIEIIKEEKYFKVKNYIWMDDVKHNQDCLEELIQLRNVNFEQLVKVTDELFTDLPDNFYYQYFDYTER